MAPASRIKNVNLAPEASFLLRNAIAPSTQWRYYSIQQSYESHCQRSGYIPYPASVKTVMHWISEIVRKVKPTTAKVYVSTLCSIHYQNHYSTNAFEDPRIELVLQGGKQIYGEGEHRTRLPLT